MIKTKAGLTRRLFLGGLAAPALVPCLARAGDVLELAKFDILGVRDPQLGMQLAVADAYGLFKEEGLDVTVRWQQASGDVLTIMGSGFPLGIGNPFSQMVLSSHNVPVKIIAALADISGAQGIVTAPNFHPAQPSDLEGKRCAFTEGTNGPLMLVGLGRRYGFDSAKIHMINMNPSEGVVAASRGDVDLLLSWQPNLFRLMTLGGRLYVTGNSLNFTDPPQTLPEGDKLLYQHSTLLASQAWIEQNPNTLKALLRGLIKGEQIYKTDRSRAMAALETTLRVPPEPLKVMTDASRYDLSISPALINTYNFTSSWAVGIRRIPAMASPEGGIDGALLAQLDPARVTWQPHG